MILFYVVHLTRASKRLLWAGPLGSCANCRGVRPDLLDTGLKNWAPTGMLAHAGRFPKSSLTQQMRSLRRRSLRIRAKGGKGVGMYVESPARRSPLCGKDAASRRPGCFDHLLTTALGHCQMRASRKRQKPIWATAEAILPTRCQGASQGSSLFSPSPHAAMTESARAHEEPEKRPRELREDDRGIAWHRSELGSLCKA